MRKDAVVDFIWINVGIIVHIGFFMYFLVIELISIIKTYKGDGEYDDLTGNVK